MRGDNAHICIMAYSYSNDASVPKFDDSAPLIIFDGHCVLCSNGVKFMLARDPHGSSRFAAIQHPTARAIYKHYDLDADRFDTFMVLKDGLPHVKWRGALAAGETLGIFWRGLSIAGRIIPTPIGDWVYDIIQRNRLTWFGSRDTCFVPDAHQHQRFLKAP